MTKTIIILVATASLAVAAVGDKAPSIPSGYKTDPQCRLGCLSDSVLLSIWNARADATNAGAKRFFDAADAWSNAAPGASAALKNFRYLIIAYQASKVGGSPNATYLQKIKDLATPAAGWDYTVGGNSYWQVSIAMALAYTAVYNDLDGATRTAFINHLHTMLSGFETSSWTSTGSGPSPYNDQTYLSGSKQVPYLMIALVLYPDDTADGLKHLRIAMDGWFNNVLPVWKQLSGGDRCAAASTDADINCGTAWHEGWSYFNQTGQTPQNWWWMLNNLAWKNATGDDVFAREGWLKNIAYWMMYVTRPDLTITKVGGSYTSGALTPEFDGVSFAAIYPGSLEGLAVLFNDPTIRGWARQLNWLSATTRYALEPSAFPFMDPDASNTVNDRSALSKVRNFPGWGTIFFRTGWGEDDTVVTLRYGDSRNSHPVFDVGDVSIYNRGALILPGGNYMPGSASPHWMQYASQTISKNTVLVKDPAENYPAESNFSLQHADGTTTTSTLENDGGQVRHGAQFSIVNAAGTVRMGPTSPSDINDWKRSREFYHRAELIGFAVGASNAYSVAIIDATAAYNNTYSHVAHTDYGKYTANTANRTYRVRKFVRSLIFIPRGTAAYVVTYDQIVSTDPSFVKTVLWHSINEPTVSGNAYTIVRDEAVTNDLDTNYWSRKRAFITHCSVTPCPASNAQYQYDGKLYGYYVTPSAGVMTKVGGPDHEFEVNGTNYNECSPGQCRPATGMTTTDYISSTPTHGTFEPGGWRIEQTMDAVRASDLALNVQLATNSSDTNVISTAPSAIDVASSGSTTPSTGGAWSYLTWRDNGDACLYETWLPKDGVGGKIKTSGTCVGTAIVNTDLLATQGGIDVPAMAWTKVTSVGERIGYVSGNTDGCNELPSFNGLACMSQYSSDSSEPNQNWFVYSIKENRNILISDTSRFQSPYWSEPGHPSGHISLDPTTSQAYAFMANSGSQLNGEGTTRTTVMFDFWGGVGRHRRSTTQPSQTTNQQACTYDIYNRKHVCWGGDSSVNTLQLYDPATNLWTINPTLTGTCPLAGLLSATATFNKNDGLVYLYGGRKANVVYGDLYTINVATLACTLITPVGTVPAVRAAASMAWDSKRNLLLMHAGTSGAATNTCSVSTPCYLDTWLYDPAANTWSEITSTVGSPTPSGTTMGPVEYRIGYDAEYDAFVTLPQGQSATAPPFFYYLRLAPGVHVGAQSITRTATSGGFNHDSGQWAQLGPTLAVSSTAAYVGFAQYGAANAGNGATPHPFVQNINTGTAVSVPNPSTFYSLTSDSITTRRETFDSTLALIGGVPWYCFNELSGSSLSMRMNCKGFSGGTWSLGGPVSEIKPTDFHLTGPGLLIDVGGVPTLIYRDNDRSLGTSPNSDTANVVQYDGAAWNFLGGPLNVQSPLGGLTSSVATSVGIATDGTSIWAAFTEYTATSASGPVRINFVNAKVYLKKWNAGTSAWDLQCSTYGNISSTGWAESASVAILGGIPYVSFTERGTVGGPPRVWVRSCSSGAWATVGTGYRNRDQNAGWAFTTRLFAHDGILDLVWDEQGSTYPWSLSANGSGFEAGIVEKVYIFASRWNGSTWANLGGALNADTAYGVATAPSVAVQGSTPIVAWGEYKFGTNRAVYAKKWDATATDWVSMGVATSAPAPVTPAPMSNFRR